MNSSFTNNPETTIRNERLISASPGHIFAAFEQPYRLAKLWGPDGFMNTFEQFEFKPGGRWIFVMHGPDGAKYPNKNVFREIEPENKIVIEHVSDPHFVLTVSLSVRGDQIELVWLQEFESSEVAERVRSRCGTANEQLPNRLEGVFAAANSDEKTRGR